MPRWGTETLLTISGKHLLFSLISIMPRWGTETTTFFALFIFPDINFDYAPMGDGNYNSSSSMLNILNINFDYAPMGDGNHLHLLFYHPN